MTKRIDLTGQKFGRLTVISYAGYINRQARWNCICDCGKSFIATSSHLLNGYTKSCGCYRQERKEKHDLSGKRFGYWTVLYQVSSKNHMSYWHCKCDCGNERDISACSLITGKSKSCGCYHRTATSQRFSTHKMSDTRLFNIHHNMKRRCYDANSTGYEHYGGRGIVVCDEWIGKCGFEKFVKWALSNGYNEKLTLDRVDTNGNYEPSNCRWATNEQQGNNKRTNHLITYNGETHTVTEWSKITGIKRETLFARIHHGWDINRLFIPPQNNKGG